MNVIFLKVRQTYVFPRDDFCSVWTVTHEKNQMLKCYPARYGGCACCWCMIFFPPQRTGSHLFSAIHLPTMSRSAPRVVVPLIVPKIDDLTTQAPPRFHTTEEYKCEAGEHWLLQNLPAPSALPLRLKLWLGDAPRIYEESFWKEGKKPCAAWRAELGESEKRFVNPRQSSIRLLMSCFSQSIL